MTPPLNPMGATAKHLAQGILGFMDKYSFQNISMISPANMESVFKLNSVHANPISSQRQFDCDLYEKALGIAFQKRELVDNYMKCEKVEGEENRVG